jgi:hypothetical protein
MTAHIHNAVVHRFAVPAWLLALVPAAAIAATLVAVLDSSAQPTPLPVQAPPSCLDTSVVGHC